MRLLKPLLQKLEMES